MVKLMERFNEVYGKDHATIYFAPGRVNLIGEHTDYNGGHVFPCALDIGTYLAVSKRNDTKLRFYSENFSSLGIIETDVRNLSNVKEDGWTNYPKGMIKILQDYGCQIDNGLDLYFLGNIPNGSGLSSSASIEVVTAVMANDIFHLDLDNITLAKLAQRSENSFMGVNCGIMDQFAVAMGKKDHAILLDTNTLQYSYVPVILGEYQLVIANTNKRRGLSDSKYNERRQECEAALIDLQTVLAIKSLGDLTIEEFNQNQKLIKNDMNRKRAKHAVYENERTLKAKEALEKGNIQLFGKLMNESHISLRDDYEVTGKELDTLVSLAWKEDGVAGSRMTGAGFGGCTVSLVKKENVEAFKKHLTEAYEKEIGYQPSFYAVNISDGARKL